MPRTLPGPPEHLNWTGPSCSDPRNEKPQTRPMSAMLERIHEARCSRKTEFYTARERKQTRREPAAEADAGPRTVRMTARSRRLTRPLQNAVNSFGERQGWADECQHREGRGQAGVKGTQRADRHGSSLDLRPDQTRVFDFGCSKRTYVCVLCTLPSLCYFSR